MTLQPTVYARLFDYATRGMEQRCRTEFRQQLGSFEDRYSQWLAGELERVYQAGVHDGFVQGIQAQESKR